MSDHSEKIKLLEEVFQAHHQRLCNHAYNITGDLDAAKDIVQEVFIKVWKNIDNIEMGAYFKFYLTKATTSTSLNYLEKHRRLSEVKDEVKQIRKGYDEENPAQVSELKTSIRKAIDRLPPKCKTIFILSRQEDMSYKEIAEHMNLSIKTVENQMGIALRKLRDDLQEYLILSGIIVPFLLIIFLLLKLGL